MRPGSQIVLYKGLDPVERQTDYIFIVTVDVIDVSAEISLDGV